MINFLDYLYPESTSHTLYIERINFIRKMTELLNNKNTKFNSFQLLLLIRFLTSGEKNLEIEQYYSKETIKNNIRELNSCIENRELKKFINSQYTAISSLLANIETNDQDFNFYSDFQSELLDFVDNYVSSLTSENKTYDIPFLYSLFLELDDERISKNLCQFLVNINDRNNMKIIKEEVKKNFDTNLSSKIFIEATKMSSLGVKNQDEEAKFDISANLDTSLLEDYSGLAWILDDEKNFPDGIKIYLGIFRKLLLNKKWKKASDFNHNHLNKLITLNSRFIRDLQDSPGERNLKSFIREKHILSRILDCVGLSLDFTSGRVKICSSRISESRLNVYGIDQFDHNRRKHNQLFEEILGCLFVKEGFWVFDFIEFIENDDSERTRELKLLRINLINVLLECIVKMIEVCKDAKLQYNQM